jgi:hypothetical protein
MVQTDGFTDFRGLQEKPGQKGEKKTQTSANPERKKPNQGIPFPIV